MKNYLASMMIILVLLVMSCSQSTPPPNPQVTPPQPPPVPPPPPIVEEIEEPVPPPSPPPQEEVQTQESSSVKEFEVTAKRWTYSPSVITVNEGDTVILHMRTLDVTHGFSLPEFGVRTTIPEGQIKTVEFVADTKGEFGFRCTVFCGSGHGNHRGMLVVQ